MYIISVLRLHWMVWRKQTNCSEDQYVFCPRFSLYECSCLHGSVNFHSLIISSLLRSCPLSTNIESGNAESLYYHYKLFSMLHRSILKSMLNWFNSGIQLHTNLSCDINVVNPKEFVREWFFMSISKIIMSQIVIGIHEIALKITYMIYIYNPIGLLFFFIDPLFKWFRLRHSHHKIGFRLWIRIRPCFSTSSSYSILCWWRIPEAQNSSSLVLIDIWHVCNFARSHLNQKWRWRENL